MTGITPRPLSEAQDVAADLCSHREVADMNRRSNHDLLRRLVGSVPTDDAPAEQRQQPQASRQPTARNGPASHPPARTTATRAVEMPDPLANNSMRPERSLDVIGNNAAATRSPATAHTLDSDAMPVYRPDNGMPPYQPNNGLRSSQPSGLTSSHGALPGPATSGRTFIGTSGRQIDLGRSGGTLAGEEYRRAVQEICGGEENGASMVRQRQQFEAYHHPTIPDAPAFGAPAIARVLGRAAMPNPLALNSLPPSQPLIPTSRNAPIAGPATAATPVAGTENDGQPSTSGTAASPMDLTGLSDGYSDSDSSTDGGEPQDHLQDTANEEPTANSAGTHNDGHNSESDSVTVIPQDMLSDRDTTPSSGPSSSSDEDEGVVGPANTITPSDDMESMADAPFSSIRRILEGPEQREPGPRPQRIDWDEARLRQQVLKRNAKQTGKRRAQQEDQEEAGPSRNSINDDEAATEPASPTVGVAGAENARVGQLGQMNGLGARENAVSRGYLLNPADGARRPMHPDVAYLLDTVRALLPAARSTRPRSEAHDSGDAEEREATSPPGPGAIDDDEPTLQPTTPSSPVNVYENEAGIRTAVRTGGVGRGPARYPRKPASTLHVPAARTPRPNQMWLTRPGGHTATYDNGEGIDFWEEAGYEESEEE